MKSMTAFANYHQPTAWGELQWEIRSVNQRYLELHFRLPDAFRHLEMMLREACKQALQRGKVEISLKFQAVSQQPGLVVNQVLLNQLSQAICQVQQLLPEATQVNPLELLNWPGVLQGDSLDKEALDQAALAAFNQTLGLLNQARDREGQQLANLIQLRIDAARNQVESVKPLMQEIVLHHQIRLKQRVAEWVETLDEARLAMELALLAQKVDIEEEIDRLHTHLNEVERVIAEPGAVGRRLDFLMQELNREANTLGSKSIDSRTTQVSVELKVLIEQMREQVQNIE